MNNSNDVFLLSAMARHGKRLQKQKQHEENINKTEQLFELINTNSALLFYKVVGMLVRVVLYSCRTKNILENYLVNLQQMKFVKN